MIDLWWFPQVPMQPSIAQLLGCLWGAQRTRVCFSLIFPRSVYWRRERQSVLELFKDPHIVKASRSIANCGPTLQMDSGVSRLVFYYRQLIFSGASSNSKCAGSFLVCREFGRTHQVLHVSVDHMSFIIEHTSEDTYGKRFFLTSGCAMEFVCGGSFSGRIQYSYSEKIYYKCYLKRSMTLFQHLRYPGHRILQEHEVLFRRCTSSVEWPLCLTLLHTYILNSIPGVRHSTSSEFPEDLHEVLSEVWFKYQ